MSDAPSSSSSMSSTGTGARSAPSPGGGPSGREDEGLVTGQGRTTIADTVVAKIAGIAAAEVSGVHALGGGTARAMGALREMVPGGGANHAQGVTVEVGERQAAVDIELTAEYGVAIADLASDIRRNVITSLERMTGLEVSEVNITVQDVYLESEDGDHDDQDRGTDQDRDRASRVQ